MKKHSFLHNHSKKSIWYLALFAVVSVVWLIVRTGTKPSRISYPCQKAAVANINIFVAALGLPFLGLTGKLLHKRILGSRVTTVVMVTVLLVIIAVSNVGVFTSVSIPIVNLAPLTLNLQSQAAVAATSSNLFIIQNASGKQGNMDAAMSALLSSMQSHGLNFFKTSANPSGLFGANDVIILKVNGQSLQRGSANTDLAKSIIKTILGHPEGFTGEVVIADNGQDTGGVDMTESNAYDHSQSMTDVAAMFPTYKVSAYSWYTIATKSVLEYSSSNYQDGYVVNSTSNAATGVKVSYPKFQTTYGTYISFKNGVWRQSNGTYDSSRLKIINMPMFKSHYDYGATSCVKNYMGVGSQTLTGMHDTVGDGGMGTLMVETRFPTLNILDGIWVNANPFQPGGSRPTYGPCGPFTTYDVASYTNLIGASTDPVALEYWVAKHVAIPAAVQRGYTYTSSIDPDYEPITPNLAQSYHHYLSASMNQIKNSGHQATTLENEMNVYVTPFSWADRNWSIIDGTWNVVNNKLYGSGSNEALITTDNTAESDYSVTMNTIINTGAANKESSIVIRYVNPTNFYYMGIGCWGHQYSIGRMLNGVPTELASFGLASNLQQGVTYNLKAAANGKTLTFYVNGAQVLQIAENTFTTGGLGIRTFSSSIQVLDISATPSPTPTPTPTAKPTPTPTPTPTSTTTPTPTSTASPTSSPSPTIFPSPSPNPITTTEPTSTPSASSSPIPTPITIPIPAATPVTSSPSPSQIPTLSLIPLAQPTETPLYLYAVAVISIFAISVSIATLLIKKRHNKKY